MIGFLKGQVLDTDGKKAIILTNNGVGYEINYGYFLQAESQCQLFIHHHISENDQSLWGFNSLEDKKLFELLKTVNKVGSSKAYPLISTVGADQVIQAIMLDQPNVLSQAQGIGKKMAEQIILSLRDKIENFQASNLATTNDFESHMKAPVTNESQQHLSVVKEALQALDSLGYRDTEVTNLVKAQIASGVTLSEDVIKNVLREL